jgi:cyclomaltodextrinase / maltogenic alpha-amylase / neopullulanase
MDGWRLDVPFKIAPDFWQEFRQIVKSVNPQAYLVGEVWREAAPWIKGDTFDGVTNYRLRDLILDYVQTNFLDGEDFGYELISLLSSHGSAAGSMLNLLDSHDTPRILTTLKGDVDRLKIALTIQMTLPGAPMVYYGDEVGLLGETDPDCRRCFPWDPQDWNKPVESITRDLISLRSRHLSLRCGFPQKLVSFNGVFAYRQVFEGDEILVILNPREAISDLEIPTCSQAIPWQDHFTHKIFPAVDGSIHFDSLPARSSCILLPVR